MVLWQTWAVHQAVRDFKNTLIILSADPILIFGLNKPSLSAPGDQLCSDRPPNLLMHGLPLRLRSGPGRPDIIIV